MENLNDLGFVKPMQSVSDSISGADVLKLWVNGTDLRAENSPWVVIFFQLVQPFSLHSASNLLLFLKLRTYTD